MDRNWLTVIDGRREEDVSAKPDGLDPTQVEIAQRYAEFAQIADLYVQRTTEALCGLNLAFGSDERGERMAELLAQTREKLDLLEAMIARERRRLVDEII